MRTHDPRYHPERVDETVFRAAGSVIVGRVTIGRDSSVWFNSVIRGDTETVEVGESTNIQDLSLLHADPGVPCRIGDRVTIGHGAIVHGAAVEEEVLIGMRAVVMNRARIGKGSIIGAGAVIPEGTEIPPRSLVLGLPGRVIRPTTDEELQRIRQSAKHYVAAAAVYRDVTG